MKERVEVIVQSSQYREITMGRISLTLLFFSSLLKNPESGDLHKISRFASDIILFTLVKIKLTAKSCRRLLIET